MVLLTHTSGSAASAHTRCALRVFDTGTQTHRSATVDDGPPVSSWRISNKIVPVSHRGSGFESFGRTGDWPKQTYFPTYDADCPRK